MNKRSLKPIGIATLSTAILAGGVLPTTSLASASQPVESKSIMTNILNDGEQDLIIDLDTALFNVINSLEREPYRWWGWIHEYEDLKESIEVYGQNIYETNTTFVTPLYVGSNLLTNDSDVAQTLSTASFSKEFTNSITTDTNSTTKFSISPSFNIGIPILGGGLSFGDLTFDWGSTESITKSETITITTPSQSITVPVGKTYKVEVYFEQKTISGEVELFADVKTLLYHGDYFNQSPTVNRKDFYYLGEVLHLAKNTEGFVQSPDDPQVVRYKGEGTFTAKYGTNLIVNVYDVTSDQRSAKLVDSKIIPLKN